MDTGTTTKTDFIKFNVSPRFKTLAAKKAREHGMTLSELGRMLFGTFVSGIINSRDEFSSDFLKLAQEAKQQHKENKGISIESREELESFLKTI